MDVITKKHIEKLKNYYGEDGKLGQYPAKRPMRVVALTRILDGFKGEEKYTEKQVNEIIKTCISFSDVEMVRRELFQYGIFDRLKDGSCYWINQERVQEYKKIISEVE